MANPPLTINGVPVSVLERTSGEGIVESWPADSYATAIVIFKCAWVDRYRVVAGLKGFIQQAPDGFVNRYPPLAYPDSPNLYCIGIDQIQGEGMKIWDQVHGWPNYEFAYITARFSALLFNFPGQEDTGYQDPSGQPWTITRLRSSGEVFSPAKGSLFYVGGAHGGQPVGEGTLGLMRCRMEISLTRRWMPYVPANAIKAFQNTVNSSPISFADTAFGTGTVLYATANTEQDTDGSGSVVHNVEHIMIANGDGHEWNQILDPDCAWVYVVNKAGQPPAAYSDFWNNLP